MADSLHLQMTGVAEMVVAESNTARHLGSGGAAVLATPELVRLMEQASVAAVDPHLPPGYQTVGYHLDVRHIAPTPVGMKVQARAALIEINERRLTFRVEASDEVERVGEGTHVRVIIQTARFSDRVKSKKSHTL